MMLTVQVEVLSFYLGIWVFCLHLERGQSMKVANEGVVESSWVDIDSSSAI